MPNKLQIVNDITLIITTFFKKQNKRIFVKVCLVYEIPDHIKKAYKSATLPIPILMMVAKFTKIER